MPTSFVHLWRVGPEMGVLRNAARFLSQGHATATLMSIGLFSTCPATERSAFRGRSGVPNFASVWRIKGSLTRCDGWQSSRWGEVSVGSVARRCAGGRRRGGGGGEADTGGPGRSG